MSFFGFRTIYGVNAEHATPYLTQAWIGRLRLHIFHRGDADPDPHNHPWPFWTFPLTSYVEEVTSRKITPKTDGSGGIMGEWTTHCQVVRAFRLHYRLASHTHRVIGRWTGDTQATFAGNLGEQYVEVMNVTNVMPARRLRLGKRGEHKMVPRKIVTIVWRGRGVRHSWGFLKHREGKWCWVPWKTYVYDGGKHAPCE